MMSPVWLGGSPNLESLIVDLQQRVLEVASDLLPFFKTYAGEARFGASVIEPDVNHLSLGDQILEIGAGILLLSCHLQREGFAVTAVEPVGRGFSHLDRLRKIVLDYASEGDFAPTLFTIPSEDLEFMSEFDYAFSINVMEHVGDVAVVLRRVLAAIKPGGRYRFLCPNYLFPYEPHFNIPTLFSKALTERLLGKYIRSSQSVADPEGTWTSLNWISVSKVRCICCKELGLEPVFDRSVLYRFIQRALHDNDFKRRRGPMITSVLQALDRLGMTRLLLKIPVVCQPAMDCVIVRA
jgi:SAM-dependent methyltransferase